MSLASSRRVIHPFASAMLFLPADRIAPNRRTLVLYAI